MNYYFSTAERVRDEPAVPLWCSSKGLENTAMSYAHAGQTGLARDTTIHNPQGIFHNVMGG